MCPPSLQVLADDLSGAAECAAGLARASRNGAALVLKGTLPTSGSWALDTDSRALPPAAAAELAADTLRRASAAASDRAVLFKKIDSTLRGNVAQELRAALALPDVVAAAVVCPTLPSQGRTLAKGVLHIHGEPQMDRQGHPLDLPRLLADADPNVRLVRPAASCTPVELAAQLASAVRAGTRILVVDAADESDLRRLARALVLAAAHVRLLAVGAAGLANALAGELLGAAGGDPAAPPPPAARPGPLVAVVGSFNSVTGRQVDELGRQPDVHLVRLNASTWIARPGVAADALAEAAVHVEQGRSIVLAASGAMPVRSSRELVHHMAAAAEPLIRRASTLVLTGGDTARTVLERLGIERLQVLGELEPGICLSRAGAEAPTIVTKAGGFGDSQSLVRVLRHFRPAATTNTARERKE